jgi:mono/diheme cytochrome c family protein
MSAQPAATAAASGKRVARAIAAAVGVFLLCSGAAPLVVANEPAAGAQMARGAEPVRLAQAAAPDVGQRVYEKWCAPCHAPGPDHPGTTALAALYKGSKPPALVDRTDLTPPVVKQFVRHGVSVMPFFRKTEISDAELDALAAFLSKGRGASSIGNR